MNIETIQEIVGKEPVFETGLLLAGDVDPNNVRRQLSRLTASGRLIQLRRGLYALAPPCQKIRPHPFLVANRMVKASYVSRQSALAHYGLIPEYVPVVTSVTTSRPCLLENPTGEYDYRHIKPGLFRGYRTVDLGDGQTALVAVPEKALLDLLYLQPGSDSGDYLRELRLENLENIDIRELKKMVRELGSPKLERSARIIEEIARTEREEYELL